MELGVVGEGFVESEVAVDLLDFALFVDVDVNDWAFHRFCSMGENAGQA